MKKVLALSVIYAFIIAALVWVASNVFSFSYYEWSFFIGLGLTVFLLIANSSGGASSSLLNYTASQSGWKIQKESKMRVNVGAFFYGSILFTIVSFIMMMVVYF